MITAKSVKSRTAGWDLRVQRGRRGSRWPPRTRAGCTAWHARPPSLDPRPREDGRRSHRRDHQANCGTASQRAERVAHDCDQADAEKKTRAHRAILAAYTPWCISIESTSARRSGTSRRSGRLAGLAVWQSGSGRPARDIPMIHVRNWQHSFANDGRDGSIPGYAHQSLVDRSMGAIHTDLGLVRLSQGARTPRHVHSFEQSAYVLQGNPIVELKHSRYQLEPGDYALFPVGAPHGWSVAAGETPSGSSWELHRSPGGPTRRSSCATNPLRERHSPRHQGERLDLPSAIRRCGLSGTTPAPAPRWRRSHSTTQPGAAIPPGWTRLSWPTVASR